MFRETLELLLGLRGDLEIVGSVGTGQQAVEVCTDVRPDEAIEFFAFRSLATRDSTITVTWSDSDDPAADRQEWRYPLP